MPKNYYIILGIPDNSTQEDIKTAYRRLAKEFHPDRYGQNQVPFQVIQEAYSVLSDPQSRNSYDRSIQPAPKINRHPHPERLRTYHNSNIEPLIPEAEHMQPGENIVNSSFGNRWSFMEDVFDRLIGDFTEQSIPQQPSSHDVSVEVSLTRSQAELGGNVQLNIPIHISCPSCYQSPRYNSACWRCNSTGVIQGNRTLHLSYPPGLQHNQMSTIKVDIKGAPPVELTVLFTISK